MRGTTFVSMSALVLVAMLAAAGVAWAAPTDSAKLRNAVTVGGIMEHENAFQATADNRAAGYEVTVQPFASPFF